MRSLLRIIWHECPSFFRQFIISLLNEKAAYKKRVEKRRIEHLKHNSPQKYADYLYKKRFGYSIDWRHPRDLNEIINYLEFNTNTSLWTQLADKYKVRDYVKNCGCEAILVPLYGKYDSFEQIDFDELPPRFVIKVNNGSGDAIIVKDKSTIDVAYVKDRINKALSSRFGLDSAEPHYLKIKPCILVEKLLGDGKIDIVDYKVWCFNGEPSFIFTCSNRSLENHTADFNLFELDWNKKNDYITEKYRNNVDVPKPHDLSLMINYAKILAKGFPQVRVDFYDVEGKIYFGEMTFTSCCGRMDYFTKDFLKEVGEKIII